MTAVLDATAARWAEAKMAEGVERGLAEGVGQGSAALLAGLMETPRLDDAGVWLRECAAGDAPPARVRKLQEAS